MSLPRQSRECALAAGPGWGPATLRRPSRISLVETRAAAHTPSRTPHRVVSSQRQIPTTLWRAADKIAITGVFVMTLRLSERGRVPLRLSGAVAIDVGVIAWFGLLLFLIYWESLATILGLYDERWLAAGGYTPRRAIVCLLGSIPLAVIPTMQGTQCLGIRGALLFGASATLVISAIQLAGQALRSVSVAGRVRRVLIVGSGPRALKAYSEITSRVGGRSEVLGFIDDQVQPELGGLGITSMGSLDQLESVLERQVVDEVHIALPVKSCYTEIQQVITACERVGAECTYPLDAFAHQSNRSFLATDRERPALTVRPRPDDDPLLIKRLFDMAVAGLLLFLLSPLLGLIALAVKLTSPGPILFSQNRYGQNKRLFRMYKFRSMRSDAEALLRDNPVLYAQYCQGNFKLPEELDPRLTRVGRFLRKSSLDELPQLWNVLRGQMAVVGPRPVVPAELVHYGPGACLLLALKPGLTSSWVLSGRSAVGYPQRAHLELGYVRNWSLWRDTSIFLKTVPLVLTGRGAH
jgi:exopolysaccharide biosynthesis polyprenyl glycosylphosphotransferase